MNPKVGVIVVLILGVLLHGLVLAWGAYANKILYIIIPSGLTCLIYAYLFIPIVYRHHYAYLPFIIYVLFLLFGICGFIGFLIYAQIKWPDYWKTELVKMLNGIVKGEFNYDVVNYSYMGMLVILFIFNLVSLIVINISFRYEAKRRTQKMVLPPVSEFDTMPYSNLDVHGPSGGEELWNVKL